MAYDDSGYPQDEAEPSMSPDTDETEDDGGETALLSKSALGGHDCKVGDKVIFEITHDHGDEIEVKYTGKHEGDEDEPSVDSREMSGAMDRLGAMAGPPDAGM